MKAPSPYPTYRSAQRTSPLAAGLAAVWAALFALASIETLASQALTRPAPAQRSAPAPAPAVVDARCEERTDTEPHFPRERQPFCTLFHCY